MKEAISIVGLGNQGRAWAANLLDSGWDVTILLRPGSKTEPRAQEAGYRTRSLQEGLPDAKAIALLIPDDAMPIFHKDYGHLFQPKQRLIFAHGFTLHYKTAPWPKNIDRILVAPKGIGTAVRQRFLDGSGVPAVLAVENDVTGKAWDMANRIAEGLGAGRAGTYRASVQDEVEADLFSEQALLCGGLPALVAETYKILVDNNISPEIAYLECVHELAFMADLMQQRGLYEMLRYASPTARFGGMEGGRRVVNQKVREDLKALFADIREKKFFDKLTEESRTGFSKTREALNRLGESSLETTGNHIRKRMMEGKTP